MGYEGYEGGIKEGGVNTGGLSNVATNYLIWIIFPYFVATNSRNMKSKPIGTRWDEDFIKRFSEKTGITKPQRVLNYLCEYWDSMVDVKITVPANPVIVPSQKQAINVQTPSEAVNTPKIEPKVPFEKEKWFFIDKYTLMPASSKPVNTALIPKWKADKIKSDAEIKKAWEKFQNEH